MCEMALECAATSRAVRLSALNSGVGSISTMFVLLPFPFPLPPIRRFHSTHAHARARSHHKGTEQNGTDDGCGDGSDVPSAPRRVHRAERRRSGDQQNPRVCSSSIPSHTHAPPTHPIARNPIPRSISRTHRRSSILHPQPNETQRTERGDGAPATGGERNEPDGRGGEGDIATATATTTTCAGAGSRSAISDGSVPRESGGCGDARISAFPSMGRGADRGTDREDRSHPDDAPIGELDEEIGDVFGSLFAHDPMVIPSNHPPIVIPPYLPLSPSRQTSQGDPGRQLWQLETEILRQQYRVMKNAMWFTVQTAELRRHVLAAMGFEPSVRG